jgi:hypothetical protein
MEAIKPTIEHQMEREGALMVKRVTGLTITNDADYERGGDILKDIKARIKAVKDYWKQPKAAAQAAHKTLVDREKQMLKPLEDAEGTVKKTMLAYTTQQRRIAEEAARKAREEEQARLAALAAQAEQQGDTDSAAFMRDMIDAAEPEQVQTAAAKGVSVRTTWKARVTDHKLVPAYFDGYELREINMTALNGLARQYEGGLDIPGVEFYMDETLSVRA